MKKLFSLFILFITCASYAQVAPSPVVSNSLEYPNQASVIHNIPFKTNTSKQKKYRSQSRWYDIVEAVSYTLPNNVFDGFYNVPIWSDSTILMNYGGTSVRPIWLKSIASYLDPVDPRYNNLSFYSGEIQITDTNSYTIDSLLINCRYIRNPAKTNIVDTLIVSVIYGDGTGVGIDLQVDSYGPATPMAMRYNVNTFSVLYGFMDLDPQSTNQFSFIASSPTRVRTIKVPLTTATLLDTINLGTNYVKIPINLNVPAGNKVAGSIVFKSGDTWIPNADTVFALGMAATPKFNYIQFFSGQEDMNADQIYTENVFSQSSIMPNDTSGWGNRHIPGYFYNINQFQHHWLDWLVSCPSCGHASNVNDFFTGVEEFAIYPNPAKNFMRLSFNVAEQLHNAKIEVINVSGVVVSSTSLGTLSRNSSVQKDISINEMAAGMYFVKLIADEGKLIEKVIIQ